MDDSRLEMGRKVLIWVVVFAVDAESLALMLLGLIHRHVVYAAAWLTTAIVITFAGLRQKR